MLAAKPPRRSRHATLSVGPAEPRARPTDWTGNSRSDSRILSSSMSERRPNPLTLLLLVASLVSIVAMVAVCGVGVVSLHQLSEVSDTALQRQVGLLDEATALQSLLYQKGFGAYYMLTRDRRWLTELQRSRATFERWLQAAQEHCEDAEARKQLQAIGDKYREYDAIRQVAIASFEAGHSPEAQAGLADAQQAMEGLLGLCQRFTELGQRQAKQELEQEHRSLRNHTWLLLLASIAGTAASLAMGYLLAQRIGKPIYELQLQVESAVQKTRISVPEGGRGLLAIGDHMAALLRKLEETDVAILEQRRRLMQSEKLSAIGEVAAKLAHEILNPLAGMKAAVQLQLRTPSGAELSSAEVRETALALDQEITRVDQLLRRLLSYARPLSPRREPCLIQRLVDQATEAARSELARAQVSLVVQSDAELRALEVDPLLITQALSNLLINAAQVSPPGGRVTLLVHKTSHLGRPYVAFLVRDDGRGISPDHMEQLFHPFFTTKPQGHGLGLAVSQNIVMEHGGQITAHNRAGAGAEFALLLPAGEP